jgi:hypothetical protein
MALASGQTAQIPLQITFRGINRSQAVEGAIRQRATGLERFSHQITRCHVIVHMPHQHRHRGNQYAIRIDVTSPAGDVFVTPDASLDESNRDFQSVLRDAFDAAVRHLEGDAQPNKAETASEDTDPAAHAASAQLLPERATQVSLDPTILDVEEAAGP